MQKRLESKQVKKETSNEFEPTGNILVITDKEKWVYDEAIIKLMQLNDEIEINVMKFYLPKAEAIINQWIALGFSPVEGLPIKWKEEEKHLDSNLSENGKILKVVYTTIIRKHPSLFKFTKD